MLEQPENYEDSQEETREELKTSAHVVGSNAPRIIRYTGKGVQLIGRGLEAAGTGMQALAPIPILGWVAAPLGKVLTVFGKGTQRAGKGIEKGGKTAEKVKDTISETKQQLGTIKNLASPSKVARLIPGPIGLALRIKDALEKLPFIGKYFKKAFDLGKKIAAGIAALILYLLALLAAKIVAVIVGAALGAAIGFIIAGPPGAVIGAVIGGYIGWTNPIGTLNALGKTIHYATHPWELAGKPWAAVKSGITSIGNGIYSGITNALSSAVSSIGSFLGGAVNATLGALGGIANFLTDLGGLSLPTSIVTVPLAVGIGGLGIGSIFITAFVAPAAFFTTQGEESVPITPPDINNFFTITKSASPSNVPNQSPRETQDIQFTVTFTVRDTRLTNISLEDIMTGYRGQVTLQTSTGPLLVAGDAPFTIDCPFIMDPSTTCTQNFTITIDSSYADTSISNTVRVTANPDSQPPQTGNAVATVTIGAAPSSCSLFNLVGSWTSAETTNIDSICALLDQAPNAIQLLRNAGVITLIKAAPRTDGVCGTVNGGNIMTIYTSSTVCSMENNALARYVIIHELGHVLGNYNFSLFTLFQTSGVYATERLMPTYPFDVDSPDESFAEMFTEYINSRVYNHLPRVWSRYPGGPWSNPGPGWTTFQQDRPLHYQFAKNQIFGGVEY